MMKLGVLGFGVVGGGVVQIADQREDMEVVKILVRPFEVELDKRTVTDIAQIASDSTIDTVVEVMGGVQPAFDFVAACLKAGKNVITANKALVSARYDELLSLAKEHNVTFRCTAAVGGGIPWLVNLARCRRVGSIQRLWGIMNGTTNYIMSTMSQQDADFSQVLSEAQKLGYAEADPSADIDGLDILRKLCISVGVAFDAALEEDSIPVFGIRNVKACDILNFRVLGRTCKLMAFAEKTAAGIAACVQPCLLGNDRLEASVPGNYNLISYDAQYVGIQSFYGQGASRYPTAYNVINDCVDLLSGETGFYTPKASPAAVQNGEIKRSYYVRTAKADAFLQSIVRQQKDGWCITEPVSVERMHAWAKQQADPELFFAGFEE